MRQEQEALLAQGMEVLVEIAERQVETVEQEAQAQVLALPRHPLEEQVAMVL